MNYSALPEILPLIMAFDPVGSEIAFPQELHEILVVACE
jgi:hypothetical protein